MAVSASDPVVLTGCGWVTPFAAGSIADVLTAACPSRGLSRRAGTRTTASTESHEPLGDEGFRSVPGEWIDDYPEFAKELKLDKGAWMTAAALVHACRDASLQIESLDAARVGLALGCGLAGQLGMIDFACEVREQSSRFVSPIHFPQTVGNYIAGALARGFKIRGPNITLAAGDASGLDAIVEACGFITAGGADVAFAGGTEQLSKPLAGSLARPGEALGEGSCLFVLERSGHATARSTRPLARVTRWGHLGERAMAVRPDDAGSEGEAGGSPILSVAGCRYPGAIFIEHWIGRCLGASGPAAVAAAIGAARQREVPLINASEVTSVSTGRITVSELPTAEGMIPALIIADADGTHRTTLEITIPASG
ncbi:MAG: hypothetical protein JSU86_02830 [Phycisphaerales bacterium]|nr:MAG: hypothetical protein JSU86_02830 [Phycisphaerales bacterium]